MACGANWRPGPFTVCSLSTPSPGDAHSWRSAPLQFPFHSPKIWPSKILVEKAPLSAKYKHTLCIHMQNLQTYIYIQRSTHAPYICNQAHAHTCTYMQTTTHSAYTDVPLHPHIHMHAQRCTQVCVPVVPNQAEPTAGTNHHHNNRGRVWSAYTVLGIELRTLFIHTDHLILVTTR